MIFKHLLKDENIKKMVKLCFNALAPNLDETDASKSLIFKYLNMTAANSEFKIHWNISQ